MKKGNVEYYMESIQRTSTRYLHSAAEFHICLLVPKNFPHGRFTLVNSRFLYATVVLGKPLKFCAGLLLTTLFQGWQFCYRNFGSFCHELLIKIKYLSLSITIYNTSILFRCSGQFRCW